MPTNPALEAAIVADPTDDAARLVYGDWLQQHGDVLGQLAPIHHALAASPADPALLEAEAALLTGHAERFFGPPHPFAEASSPARPDPERWDRWRSEGGDEGWVYGHARVHFRTGFFDRVWFDTFYHCEEDESYGAGEAAAVLAGLLAGPAARFVREIRIGDVWVGEPFEVDLGPVLAAVAAAPCADALRIVRCVGGEHDISGVHCDASGLWAACPRLEEVVLYGNDIQVGALDAPGLRRLALHSGGLSGSTVRAVCAANLPALEELELWFGCERYGASASVDDVEAVLRGDRFPALRRLGLKNSEFGDDLCRVLPAAPILPRLTRLDLTMGIVTDAGARALIDAAAALSHLELLVAGYFSDEVIAALQGMGAVVHRRGRPDQRYRYAEVGE